jgi:hypothetical protein
MGQKYYDGTMPTIARALEGIHEELIRQNGIREFLQKNANSIPPCPSCHKEHAMYDHGKFYECEYCNYEVRKL